MEELVESIEQFIKSWEHCVEVFSKVENIDQYIGADYPLDKSPADKLVDFYQWQVSVDKFVPRTWSFMGRKEVYKFINDYVLHLNSGCGLQVKFAHNEACLCHIMKAQSDDLYYFNNFDMVWDSYSSYKPVIERFNDFLNKLESLVTHSSYVECGAFYVHTISLIDFGLNGPAWS